MKLSSKLTIIAGVFAVSASVVVACGSSSDSGGANPGGGASAGAGGGGGSGADGGGGMITPDGGGGYIDVGTGNDVVSEGFDPDAACAASTVSATLTPANILFLIDRTGSMNCNAPPTQTSANCNNNPTKVKPNEPSKWEITRDALSQAIQGLEASNPLPSIGIMYFNSDDFCGIPSQPNVEVGPLNGNASNDPKLNALQLSLNGVVPKGETPIIGSTMSAFQYMHSHEADFTGNRFVVLLTDGAETCDTRPGSKEFLIQKAGEAANLVNIRTFVLGAPGSEEERGFLSAIAHAGGTASSPTCDHDLTSPNGNCHMDMTLPGMDFADQLQKNLEAISSVALSCEFDVPKPAPGQPPVDPTKVNVKYSSGSTSEYIPQDNTVACDDPNNQGWQYDSTQTKILLCGQVCDKVKSDPHASISIELGCQTQVVPK
jgi:hypothetical protein